MSEQMQNTPPRTPMERGSKIQLAAIVGVTLLVMIMGILVVAFPHQFGLPGLDATPSPVATPATPAP